MFPCSGAPVQHLLRTQNLRPRRKNVSDFFQKYFASSTNVSWFARQGSKTFVLLPTRLLAVETLRATMFPQQCFLVCGGLYVSKNVRKASINHQLLLLNANRKLCFYNLFLKTDIKN